MESSAMAYVVEVQTKLVGMYFLLRRVVKKAKVGFEYMPPSGGTMAPRVRDRRPSV
jgi:hypothetical protein